MGINKTRTFTTGRHKKMYDTARELMVKKQIAARGIQDKRVLEAMRKVPRHRFVPGHKLGAAYHDSALPIGQGQTISQPYIVALMTELLELKETDRVLEIGTGSGYQAAVLAQIVEQVITIERLAPLANETRALLAELGYSNIHIKIGDGSLGWPKQAPYDAIIVTAAAPQVPEPLKKQLAAGGRLVAPTGRRFSQELVRVRRTGDQLTTESLLGVVFVPLIGKYGWQSRGSTRL